MRVEQVMDFFSRGLRRKKHADLVHWSTISLQVLIETVEFQVDGLWSVDSRLSTIKIFKQFPSPRYSLPKE